MEDTNSPKNLVLMQQSGTALAAAATFAIAAIKIYKLVKNPTEDTTAE